MVEELKGIQSLQQQQVQLLCRNNQLLGMFLGKATNETGGTEKF